ARDARVVAVSAIDGNLQLASFSNRGAQIELAAPGVHMLGPLPGHAVGFEMEHAFAFGSGTSQAVAYAAGAAALVRDLAPSLSAAEAREILGATARDLGAPGRDASYGRGVVEVDAAAAAAAAR
ncbi:MAG TPA: S8 family serine peptidase, partial [Candidatus Thermoplasmatota archaeon]|nr:S8 family serine peptidase [Candidatus Thermoplasmatota archaeon]